MSEFEGTDRRMNNDHQEARLSRVEAMLESSVKSLEGQIGKISETLTQVAQNQVNSSKTNWGVLGTWGGVLIMVMVGLGNGYVGQPLHNLQQEVTDTKLYYNKLMADAYTWRTENSVTDAATKATFEARYLEIVSDIEEDKKLTDKIHSTLHKSITTDTEHEARLQNLERIIFSDAQYREGKPN